MFGTISNMLGFSSGFTGLSGWFIRLPFAGVFLYHGITKFTGGIEGFAGMLSGFGALAMPIAILVAVGEVLAGIGAIAGGISKDDFGNAVTKLAGLAAIPIMLGAIFLVHLPNGWNVMDGGMEFQVCLLGVALFMFVRGKDL